MAVFEDYKDIDTHPEDDREENLEEVYDWGRKQVVRPKKTLYTRDGKEIVWLPYKPRYPWVHKQLKKHRYFVLVAHRRFGKTVLTIAHMVEKAMSLPLEDGRFLFIAPQRNQAKSVAWTYLLRHFKVIKERCPQAKKNESELYIEIPNAYVDPRTGEQGISRITLYGASDPDTIRGNYADGAVLDEYGQMDRTLFDEILTPMLSDSSREIPGNQWCVFLGTPKGQNQFYEVRNKALRNLEQAKIDGVTPEYGTDTYNVSKTSTYPEAIRPLSDDAIARNKRTMSSQAYAQEFECDFTVSGEDTLIPLTLIERSISMKYNGKEMDGMPIIMGFDGSKQNSGLNDKAILTVRHGLLQLWEKDLAKFDEVEKAAIISREAIKLDVDAIIIDNFSFGLVDILKTTYGLKNIIPINFGSSSSDPKYVNKRVEMWVGIKTWMENGGKILDEYELKQELSTPTTGQNNREQVVLMKKDKIKEILGRSPDHADALCLTFAVKIKGKTKKEKAWKRAVASLKGGGQSDLNKTVTKYDVFQRRKD